MYVHVCVCGVSQGTFYEGVSSWSAHIIWKIASTESKTEDLPRNDNEGTREDRRRYLTDFQDQANLFSVYFHPKNERQKPGPVATCWLIQLDWGLMFTLLRRELCCLLPMSARSRVHGGTGYIHSFPSPCCPCFESWCSPFSVLLFSVSSHNLQSTTVMPLDLI